MVAVDSVVACSADTAKASTIDQPITPADSAAHQIVAHLCSAGSAVGATAYFILDQRGGSKGRLKIVALDPTDPDSNRVVESSDVTYNGGIDGEFSPVVLKATSIHQSAQLQVTVVGSGLASAHSLMVSAPDNLWNVPLTITDQTDSSITATANVPAILPEAVLQMGGSGTLAGLAPLAADQVLAPDVSYPDTIEFRDPNWTSNPATTVYPKDFAFYYNEVPTNDAQHPWRGLFHLIYIRHNKNYAGDAAESLLVHAWSRDLAHWQVDKRAFSPDTNNVGAWDHLHVWAPSLMQVGNLTYMFYTGVDANHNQRIGYATTALFDTSNTIWARQSQPTYGASNTSWADAAGLGNFGQIQFRDPFLMADPDSAGRYLMFNVGEDKKFGADSRMVVGVARNAPGSLAVWKDRGAYRSTDYSHNGGITRDESPLVVRDSSGTGAWRIFFANAEYNDTGSNSTYFVTESMNLSVADTTLASWPELTNMFTYLGNDGSLLGWEACEHLQVGKNHLFAAYNGDGIGITQAHWNAATGNFVIGYPNLTAVSGGTFESGVRFYLSDFSPGSQSVRFVLDIPKRMSPRLMVYDLTGRRVRTLADGRSVQGRQEFLWDCRDAQGARVPTGMYFARLSDAGAARVLRVPVLR